MALKDSVGRWGELYALRYLKSVGFTIAHTNFRSSIGELDVVAFENDCLVICEVKTRRGSRAGVAGEAIDATRLARLRSSAEQVLSERSDASTVRVDAVLIDVDGEGIHLNHVRDIS
jgi:putative endonuclease